MKIETHQLAMYIPYGISAVDKIGTVWELTYRNLEFAISKQWKPILKHITDMDDDTFKSFGFADEEDLLLSIYSGDIPHNDFMKLVSQRYDVYGLLTEGLALNALEYE